MARARTAPPRVVPVDCSSSNDARERDATRRREGAFVAPGRAESTPVATRNVTFLDARPGPGRLVPLAITDAASSIKFLPGRSVGTYVRLRKYLRSLWSLRPYVRSHW